MAVAFKQDVAETHEENSQQLKGHLACHKQSLTGDFLCVLEILLAMLRFRLWTVAFLLSSVLGALGHGGYLDCAASRDFEGVGFGSQKYCLRCQYLG